MGRLHHRAFTRLDLLAVLAVAGVGFMILLPAIQHSRAEGTRLVCADNLKRIVQALNGFETTNNGELIRNLYGPQLAGPGDHVAHGGLTLLLPYLEQESLFNRYNFSVHFVDPANQEVTGTVLPFLQCPEAVPGRRSLPGNAPLNPAWQGAISDYASIRWTHFPIGPAHDPMGLGALEQKLFVPEIAQVRVYRSMITDGVASTIAYVERAGNPDVWVKGKKLGDGSTMNTPVGDEPRGPWAGYSCININTFSPDGLTSIPAGPCTINCRNVIGQFSHGGPYSFHAGGAYASFMDGSVRVVREGMSPYVLFALGSRAGGEVIGPDEF